MVFGSIRTEPLPRQSARPLPMTPAGSVAIVIFHNFSILAHHCTLSVAVCNPLRLGNAVAHAASISPAGGRAAYINLVPRVQQPQPLPFLLRQPLSKIQHSTKMSSGKTVTLNTGHKIPYVSALISSAPPARTLTNVSIIGSWDTAHGKRAPVRLEMASMKP